MTDNPRRRSGRVREKETMEEGNSRGGGWLEIEEAGDVTEEEIDTSRGSKGTGVKTNL